MKLIVPSKLPFYLLAVQVVVLIAATIVEHLWGSAAAYAHIYRSVPFRLLWTGIVFTGVWVIVRRRLWHRLHALVLHASFVVILVGALCTAFGSVNGNLHLRVGKSSRLFLTDDKDVGRLPFDVKLTHFTVHHYPGTDTPSDYESRLRVAGRDYVVSMNRIAEIDGWRIYQTSYDTDGKGSVLSLYHDPWGLLLTYVGYGLLFVSLLWSLLARGGAFRTLLRHPALRRTAFVLLLGAGWGSIGASASDFSAGALRTIARSKADSIGWRQIVYNGRVCPLNTLAVDFCKKNLGQTEFSRTQRRTSLALVGVLSRRVAKCGHGAHQKCGFARAPVHRRRLCLGGAVVCRRPIPFAATDGRRTRSVFAVGARHPGHR